jgi:hypothetical protein
MWSHVMNSQHCPGTVQGDPGDGNPLGQVPLHGAPEEDEFSVLPEEDVSPPEVVTTEPHPAQLTTPPTPKAHKRGSPNRMARADAFVQTVFMR